MAAVKDNLARKQIFIPANVPEEEIVLRVAAYCRVSTDSDDQINSFTAQNSHYMEMITAHDRWELVDIYADEGITGTSAKKRKDFQRLLADCRNGRIDKVLVKSISRFARNTTECLEAVRELKSLGISIFFEEHSIDTKMVSSEMLTAVIASCAQAESESISRNMRWSVQKRMESGTFNTCRAATGFRLGEDGLRIAPEEAPVIYGIFADYLQGKNSREIAGRLNAENALGRVWNRKLVDYILTNERYAGNAILQKKYRTETIPRIKKPNRGERPMYFVRNSNPAIITQEMFDQAAQLRSSRRNETCNMGARPFAKKLSCGCCGSLFRSKRIDDTWYWVCRKHEEPNVLCEMPPVPENEIKAAFQRLYYNLKHNTAVLDFYAKHLILVRNRQMLWSPAAIELNKEISDILDQSHTLSLLNRQRMVDPDIFITKNNQLAERLRKAKQQKEKLHNLEHDQVIDQTQQLQETLLTGPEILDAFDEELFCELIDRITVQSNTQVRFRLKNGLELTESMERTVR